MRKLNELSVNYQNLQGNYKELTANYISIKKDIQKLSRAKKNWRILFWIKEHSRRNQKQTRWSRRPNQWAGGQSRKASQKHQEKEKRLKKNEEVLREMQDNMKQNNIRIIGRPEGEEEQRIEYLFEKVMMENFPNWMREEATKSRRQRGSQSRGTQRGPLKSTS